MYKIYAVNESNYPIIYTHGYFATKKGAFKKLLALKRQAVFEEVRARKFRKVLSPDNYRYAGREYYISEHDVES